MAIIEPSLLVAPSRLKQQVGNLIHISELGTASEVDNLVDQRQELPFKGGDQGSLLLQGEADQVVVVET